MEVKTLPDSSEDISTFYIQATESIQQRWPRTLKQGDTFGLFDALGDCVAPALTPQLAAGEPARFYPLAAWRW